MFSGNLAIALDVVIFVLVVSSNRCSAPPSSRYALLWTILFYSWLPIRYSYAVDFDQKAKGQ